MSDETITFAVLGAAIVVFVLDRLPVAIVAVGVALSLWATGVLDLEQALAGFGDPTVIFIASLFVVSEGLDAAGVTAWLGRRLVESAGESRARLLVALLVLVSLLTALINVNGAVAALLPVVVVTAVRLQQSPSGLLMPLAFGAHAGSLLTLTGTPVNVLVSEAARDAGVGSFGYFEFALAGVPLVLATRPGVGLYAEPLLPDRRPRSLPPDFSAHARMLVEQYRLDHGADTLLTRGSGVAEVVIPPRSELVGEPAFPGMVTESGDLLVLAVQRSGETLDHEIDLEVGDTLLLQGSWAALDERLDPAEVLVVDAPRAVRRQAVALGGGAKRALAVLALMVVALATGVIPAAVAGLLAAGALVVLGVVRIEEAYRSVSWTTVILVAGMIPLSTAMVQTGAAERLANGITSLVGDAGPRMLLLAVVLLTVVLGQLISNTATALIVIPIAVTAAGDAGISAQPVLMAVAVAAAAAFLTPVATPANLMVMGPGGYRFGDYARLGLPLLVVFVVVAVLLVPLIWGF
jgi:di/tricarboxylate transporter